MFPVDHVQKILTLVLSQNNHHYSPAIQQQWIDYLALLHRWNKVVNLTAIRDPKEMIFQHLLDSLSLLPYLQGNRFIDVGSGAGLPGIPLAIAEPDKQFYLLDSNNKKTNFLTQVIIELGLKNVHIINQRCEKFHPDFCFDQILTRAFSSLKNMLTFTQHLLCPQGEFLAMKGVYPEEEIKEISPHFEVITVYSLLFKGWDVERCLVKIKLKKGAL